ncbi:HAD family phosphatase [Aestuariivirga sp.]|uniref:HAD family phosphatase n=1 Tax=Aestuariivirga sp. TaxID=2650926 RepID=UPI00391924EF
MTDLDGTAIHEFEGRLAIPERVALALRELNESGRQVVINSLRFPLNVIRTFGREWYSVTSAPLPIISLNGSLTGYLTEAEDGQIAFRELDAFCLARSDVDELIEQTSELLNAGADEMAIFLYPRDWTKGELIWAPTPRTVEPFRAKYLSASEVFTSSLVDLKARLVAEPHCMVFALIEATGDRLMAYQHVSQRRFVTRRGVDKRFGAHALCERLGLAFDASVGAGDTLMDTFLSGIGLAITVGAGELGFEGKHGSLRVASSSELGDLLFRLAELDREMRAQ